jgi:hypothetical protein
MLEPGLYPRDLPRPTTSEAELTLYEALKKDLPKGWYAWHSLKIRTKMGFEGEGDFVFAVPNRGMMVMEVKSGHISVRDGHWIQNGREMEKSPRVQAYSTCGLLLERLVGRKCAPPAYGVATAFPDIDFEAPPGAGDLEGIVLGKQSLRCLTEELQAVFARAVTKEHKQAGGKWIENVHSLWCETWIPRPRLGDRVRLDEQDRVQLDAAQLDSLDMIEENDRVLVQGGAGTGKTILAREAARRQAAAGRKVLMLCFTDALAEWLRSQTQQQGLQVAAIKRFSQSLLEEAGVAFTAEDTATFWRDVPLKAASDALPRLNHKWDCIVIDEAQDFSEQDWLLVNEISEGKRLWAFCDPTQAFWPERMLPKGLFTTTSKLKRPYRCPRGIFELAQAYAGQAFNTKHIKGAIDDGSLKLVACPSVSSVPEMLEREIVNLRQKDVLPSQIAMLSMQGLNAKGSVVYGNCLGVNKLVRADGKEIEKHIVGDSFLRFKGLERPAIIVTDLEGVKNQFGTRMHIALTRTLSVVRIVAAKETLAKDSVLKKTGISP